MRKTMTLTALLLAALLAACDLNAPQQDVTPTFQLTSTATLPPSSPTLTATATATTRIVAQAQLESPTATLPPGTPTETPTPTPTPGPYEHVIQQGETLGFIVQIYGYRDLNIYDEIVALNSMTSPDILPPPGTVLLIPRQTITPTPVGMGATSEARATMGVNVEGLPDYPVGCHTVTEGETMVDIALQYRMTLEQLSMVNPDISFSGCDFDEPSGGPNCTIFISVNQCVNVFLPTLTPTLSPTPSGSETPTATPTYSAPIVSYPPEGAVVPPGLLRLQWVSVGVLQSNEYYFVQISDVTAGVVYANQVTRETSLLLPAELIPTDGQTHTFQWTVAVAQQNDQGTFRIVGAVSQPRTFQWQSR
ncbi:MAG: LysM peptidoglycan-binding domain-containing protein [Chloroflexi bacterium]|nr:LysM peptidoglycan-binding domain-containing protein [Chloroflexota bacterium]